MRNADNGRGIYPFPIELAVIALALDFHVCASSGHVEEIAGVPAGVLTSFLIYTGESWTAKMDIPDMHA
jgi:hypothetical protein